MLIVPSLKNFYATATRASSGQGKNQSIVQELKRAGNHHALSLNFNPTGENDRTM